MAHSIEDHLNALKAAADRASGTIGSRRRQRRPVNSPAIQGFKQGMGRMDDIVEVRKALTAAEQFIVNGVELGYIRMPDPETPDSAHQTLPMIRQAQESFERTVEAFRRAERLIEARVMDDMIEPFRRASLSTPHTPTGE